MGRRTTPRRAAMSARGRPNSWALRGPPSQGESRGRRDVEACGWNRHRVRRGVVDLAGAAQAQGLTVTATQTLSPRLTQYTVTSAALGRSSNVRILLPEGYATAGAKRYPVLLLLHGCCDDYRSLGGQGPRRAADGAVSADRGHARRRLLWLVLGPVQRGRVRAAALRVVRFRRAAAVGRRDVPLDRRARGAARSPGLSMGGSARSSTPRAIRRCSPPPRATGGGPNASRSPRRYADLIPDAVWGRARPTSSLREHNPLDLAAPAWPEAARAAHRQRRRRAARHAHQRATDLKFEVSARERVAARPARPSWTSARLRRLRARVHDWPYWARDLDRDPAQPRRGLPDDRAVTVGGTVPSALMLTLNGGAASLGAFVAGRGAHVHGAALAATVTSTAGGRRR